ncbi:MULTISPECIES: FG-GAP-like repeat-containing protein [Arthrobacter]|uniref:FG-GAP-like repeat-containing protein n=1 Tax=Arthrobacter TaxID=1663 RepID=UPI001D142B24|nr:MULTISPECIES: FG-GAP-like repeat-containing protein [Arthrobacter]MCC3282568.1 FG-GAP-like repeat-containing protein [Arthrobacter caoxuetaonis]MCC9193752.1 FG-GAP-like repeat-containing protein [Arthrobacter sp. zg-Y916]
MKTGKLALLATLTAGLVFGGLPPAAAVTAEPAFPDAVLESPGGPEPTALPGEVPADALNGGAEPLPAPISPVPEVSPAPEVSPESTAPAEQAVPLDVADASNTPEETAVPEDDGYEYVPVGKGHVVPGPDTPLVTEADGSVRSAVETEHQHVEPMLARGGAASMLSAAARAGNIKVTLVRATVIGNGNLVNLTSARNSVSSASNYWKTMSNGRLSMSVASEKIHRSANARASDDYATMMNKIAKELKWVDNPYTALVVFVPTADLRSGGYGGILGGGWTVGGTAGRILMPAPSNFTNNVVTHEFGHVLGLLHANSLQCTNGRSDVGPGSNGRWADGACTSREYGDTTDLMGSAQNHQPVINSYFWDAGSFGRGNEILDAGKANGSRTFSLRPWGGSAANRAVKFTDPVSGDAYYVELRQPAGYDQHLQWAAAGNRGVKIVKADGANSWAINSLIIPPSTRPFAGYYNANHAWQAGQTFTTHTGTKIRINSVNASAASITVSAPVQDDWSYRAFTPGDFNGDGVADMISRRTDGTLWLTPGKSNGTFGAAVRIGSGWQIFNLLIGPGDYDGDGRNDILARGTDGSLWLYSGTGKVGSGNEGYRAGRKIGIGGWDAFRQILPMFEAGGGRRADLLAVGHDGKGYLYKGTGKGEHGSSRYVSGGWNSYNQVLGAGDFNGDGQNDVIGRTPDGRMVFLAGRGNGAFGGGFTIGTGWNIYQEIHGGFDFNKDGKPDLIGRSTDRSLAFYAGTRSVWLSEGYKPGIRTQTPNLGSTRQTISVKDFNGDKRADLLSVRRDGTLWLHPGTTAGKHGTPVRIGTGWNIFSEVISPGDFNGDGRSDLLARKPDGTLWFYAGTGDAGVRKSEGYKHAQKVGTGWNIFRQVLGSADLNGDNRADLIGRHSDGSLWFYAGTGRVGNGHEGYASARKIGEFGWENLTLTAAGDYDRSGTNDILARTAAGSLLLYRGGGNGALYPGEQVGTGWNIFASLLGTGDTTSDGIPDLLGVTPAGQTWHYSGDGMKSEGYLSRRAAGRL